MIKAKTTLVVLAVVAAVGALPVSAAEIYTAQYRGDLFSCDLDGSNPSQLATSGGVARYDDVDVTDNYIFAGLGAFGSVTGVYRYDLDGSNPTLLASGSVIVDGGVAVTADSLYYVTSGAAGEIHRADFDGGNDTVVYTLGDGPAAYVGGGSLVVAEAAMYWVADGRRVQTCGLDGSGAMQLFDTGSGSGLSSLCCDENFIYYAVDETDAICRRNLDGSGETTLATGASAVRSLQVVDGLLYWADGARNVYSMGLVGGSPVQQFSFDAAFATGSTRAIYIDVVPEPTSLGLLAGGLAFALRRRRRA